MSSYANNPRYKELTWKIHHAVNALNEYPELEEILEVEEGDTLDWNDIYTGWYDWAMKSLTWRDKLKLYIKTRLL